ncbi:unnamed protein product [Arabis nemorensis]|uniref:Uncharacterized protein n=1 Tax=Arabis nemorensis TaxID=586526 RepID=A0A565B8J5_9BRAS|nr:unnamed protein product [Arabis nemorensis]
MATRTTRKSTKPFVSKRNRRESPRFQAISQSPKGIRLDDRTKDARFRLIEKELGFEEAEKFFVSIPENLRDESIYIDVLSRYAKSGKKIMSKAEKMRERGLPSKPSPYTSIYGSMVIRDKVDEILRDR